LAQRLAVARGADVLLEFSPAAEPYQGYAVHQQGGGTEPDFPKTFEAAIRVTGPAAFTFRPDGSATADGIVSITVNGSTATVQVWSATGRVSVANP
jgi:hypothetical protein